MTDEDKWMSPKCHPHSPAWVIIREGGVIISLLCSVCNAAVVDLEIARVVTPESTKEVIH